MHAYQRLNHVYRALDIYNFPTGFTLNKQLESIRVLHEYRTKTSNYRILPSVSDIQTRLQNLTYEIYNTPNNTQILHELMDTAMEIGVALPTLELDAQQNLLREYERYTVRADKPIPKDIYSLDAIVQDSQNVHHTSINEHMKTLVRKIVQDYPVVNSTNDWIALKKELAHSHRKWKLSHLTPLTFIYENTCTFTIGITLKQLILSVFQFIRKQSVELQNELFTRLNEELDDMRNKCSTGHLSRLVNVVQGFSERYTLKIQPKEEIKAFVYHYLTKRLQEAPDSVQEGMTEQTQECQDYILSKEHEEYFEQRFGTDHNEWIQTCMRQFLFGFET